ncbi:hypothetical protein PENTCL1PPCAC_20035, partial [Pristionchus entomophagus]
QVESLQNDVETERREKDAAIPANENSQNLLEEAKMKLEKFVAETNEKIESLKKELDSKRSAKEAALAANEKQHQQTVSFKKEIESERRATESAVAANKKLQ